MPRPPIDPMVLEDLEKQDPGLVSRYRAKMQASDSEIEGAQKGKNLAGYSGVAGQLATDFINSQRGDMVYHNRMQDLGKAPKIDKVDQYQWDNSIVDRMADEGMQNARQKRADGVQDMMTEEKFRGMDSAAAQQAMMKDPNSEASKRTRAAIVQMMPGIEKDIPEFETMSAEQADRIMPMLKDRWQADRQDAMRKEDIGLKKQEMGLKQEALKAKQSGTGLTVGQKKVDEDYAKHYNTFTQKGAVNAKTAINNLEKLAEEMEDDTGYFQSGGGRFATAAPDMFRSRDAIRRRDQARNFANTTLKELFGGQLSDGEREAAAKEYYNDGLDNEENAKIIRTKIKQLRDSYDTEVEKARFYEENGTLSGFRGLPADTDPQEEKISLFMKANNISSRGEAEKILREAGRIQ